MSYLEGTIEIPMSEFWEFVSQYNPTKAMVTVCGVPRITKDADTMEIDFAASSEGDPNDWAKKPMAAIQWEEYKKEETKDGN